MATKRVGDMTLEELKEIIRDMMLDWQRLEKPTESSNVGEIVAHIQQHRWTPPPGSATNQELVREDRDR